MMVVPPQKQQVQEVWEKFNTLQAKTESGTLGEADVNTFELLKVEIALIQAEAMVTLALRQQGPW